MKRSWHRTVPFLVAAAVVALAMVAPASAAKPDRTVRRVTVATRLVPGLGRILVNAQGRTLYLFLRDERKQVTCVRACARTWQPLKLARRAKLVAKGGVKRKLLGSDRSPAGGHVVTYNGWPLYTYRGDRKDGDAAGQALKRNGGLWYVLTPSGAPIKTNASSGSDVCG